MQVDRRTLLQGACVAAVAGAVSVRAAAGEIAELTWTPAWKLVDMIKRKTISPVELTKHYLARIDRINPKINAYVTVDHEGALVQAKVAEQAVMRGDALGALHGIPISIKDLALTKGLCSTDGSLIFKDRIPDHDDIFVARLRKAGVVILGKNNTPEFGKFARSMNRVIGETRNPWDTRRITGASSGGAGAASAAGISPFAIASDGGGSTRIPAHFNGVFGLQPSPGRLPLLEPILAGPQQASFGPMTLDVMDAAIIMNAMAGPDPRDPSAIQTPTPDFTAGLNDGIKGFKIAWSDDFGHIPILDLRVLKTQKSSAYLLERAGATVEDPAIKLYDFFEPWAISNAALGSVAKIRGFSEEQKALISPPVAQTMLRDRPIPTADDIAKAERVRADIRTRFEALFDRYDVICTPISTTIAPIAPAGWEQPYADPTYGAQFGTPYTHVVNFLGLTAASVPCGFVDGLPVGLQVIARRMNETKAFRVAQALALLQPWDSKHPALAI